MKRIWLVRFPIALLLMVGLTAIALWGGAYAIMQNMYNMQITDEQLNQAIVIGLLMVRVMVCFFGGTILHPPHHALLWGMLLGMVYLGVAALVGILLWEKTITSAIVLDFFIAATSAGIGAKIRKKHFSEGT